MLGDSHTEALQVNDDIKFVSVAETLLHSRGVPADLRNFGRSGTSMADYVWLAPILRRRFQPAAIVIEIDEYDFDFRAFDPKAPNHFVVRSPETIELIHASGAAAQAELLPLVTRWFTGLTRVFTLLEYAQYRFNLPRNRAADAEVARLPGLDPVLSVRLQAELLREAAGGTPVILLRLPYSPYPSAIGNPLFTALRQVLPWPFLDPSGAFQKSREQGRDPRTFYNTSLGGGHLNATGHAIVARMLADELDKLLQ